MPGNILFISSAGSGMTQRHPSKLDRPEILAALFHPRKESRSCSVPDSRDLDIEIVDQGVALGCRFYGSDPEAANILYFHGNGETVGDYDYVAPLYLAAGLNLMVATYRGYGWSTGEPSVSALLDDCSAVFERFQRFCAEHDLGGDCFVMGRSLGSASSIELAYRFPDRLKGLIIDSGFAYTLPLAARLGCDLSASDLTEEDCFNNLAKIMETELPTLILHGAEDQIIPMQEAVKLQAESGAKNKQLFVVPGADHNSLISLGGEHYFDTIKKFTDTVSGKNTWRQRRRKFKKTKGEL